MILKGPLGAKVILDQSQVFPEDPGNGTPAIVEYKGGTATYWCAINEEHVYHETAGEIRLPQSVVDWLDSSKISNAVDSLFE